MFVSATLRRRLTGFSLATLLFSFVFGSLLSVSLFAPGRAVAVDGLITIVKQTVPDGAEESFDFYGEGEGIGEGSDLEYFSLSDGESESDAVSPGSYEISEEGAGEGWELTSIECDDDDSEGEESTAYINVSEGEEVTCTFTNTHFADVTIYKYVSEGEGGEQAFDFSGSLGEDATLYDGEGTEFSVAPGSYTYGESVPDNWDLVDIECEGAGEGVAERTGDGLEFALEGGEDLECSFYNEERQLDFGDAPDGDDDDDDGGTYPTLLENDGARHEIDSDDDDDGEDGVFEDVLLLGETVDAEEDGQPDGEAEGDDYDGEDEGYDDEDGVEFNSSLVPGGAADISVYASDEGKLDAWVDFNFDGDWDDEGEQIFHSKTLGGGENDLSFPVPSGLENGSTYARFRFSSAGCLLPTGLAEDGEVEDYQVYIDDEGESGEGLGELDEGASAECGGDTAPAGGVQGSRYRRQNLIRFLMGMGNTGYGDTGLPQSAFGGPGPGGGTGELTQEQLEALCAVRDHITLLASFDILGFIAENYAHIYDVPEEVTLDVLENGTGCDAINAAKAEQARLLAEAEAKAAADKLAAELAAIEARKPKPIVFNVGEDGYPVSSDPIFNACIRNVQLFVEGQMKPISCNAYHEGHTWKHPDMLISFNFSDRIMKHIRVRGETVATNVVESPQYVVRKFLFKNYMISKLTVPSLMVFADRSLDLTNFNRSLVINDDGNTAVLSEQSVDLD